MHLSILLDMAADAFADRVATTSSEGSLTFAELRDGAARLAALRAGIAGERTIFLGVNSLAVPLTLFASALTGTAFTPLNYRLPAAELLALAERARPAVAVVDDEMASALVDAGVDVIARSRALDVARSMAAATAGDADGDGDDIAVLLFTSGTTGEPKAAVLRHTHLTSYVLSTMEFGSAGPDEAALVSVPPYHIAGIAAVVTSLYAGRRLVYLDAFTPEGWVAAVAAQRITHAMVVPTMVGRVLDVLDERSEQLPTLRHLSYGGGRMPVEVIERAMRTLPHVDFVNAYGLTETSSTISVLGPDDHRAALASEDPVVRRRLGSVGRPHDGIEVAVRDELGASVGPDTFGEIWVRGPQVSGEYVGRASRARDGWFPTNDGGRFDAGGYLFVDGRLDDVIVRGGENISPGEVEDVLRAHPDVADVCVVGVPSREWGEEVVAAVVARETSSVREQALQEWVRSHLRSSRVPARIALRDELPYNETGKLLRRVVRAELAASVHTPDIERNEDAR